jgi:uncharacterized membrane protein YphA (DoxX/SURF4 family)
VSRSSRRPTNPIGVLEASNLKGFACDIPLLRFVRVQSFFSAFPGRWPGAGLLLLRAAVGPTLLMQGAAYLGSRGDPTIQAIAGGLLAVLLGTALVIGFLTPAAGIGAGLFSAMNGLAWLPIPAPSPIQGGLLPFFVVIVSLAIALLGPGAFSLDSYLFGRREIVIPPDTHPHSVT